MAPITTAAGRGFSRRGFLAGGAGAAALLSLAACTGGGGSSGSSSELSLLLPGVAPTGWSTVLAAVNTKLEKDQGFTIKPEFINWQNYSNQSLLKFTAGENFATALSARWLNISKLISDGALTGLSSQLASGTHSNLASTISTEALEANRWSDGELYGVPAVNSAGRIHHYSVRGDLADTYAGGTIDSYDALEKFWYDVKQKEGITPYVARLSTFSSIGAPTGVFYRQGWEKPDMIPVYFSADSLMFVPAADATATGSSKLVPFWEHEPHVEALRATRQYYLDGIINADMLNIDAATVQSQFQSGAAASTWAITDGTATTTNLPGLLKAVPGASLLDVMPFAEGLAAKPNQLFQADNIVVVNKASKNQEQALQLLDWVSIAENHDLLEYGVEGKDWNAVGEDSFESISDYNNFPGYALSWRVPLERLSSTIAESEKQNFLWAKDYENFTTDPFASFIPDLAPVEAENAQITQALAQYGNPLYAGAVDVDKGLDDLKKAVEAAGLDKVQAELEKQANAYLAAK
ncbi:ABC transporter substrate-binding protein [Rathayibacter sp. SD072]|uniref:ABC transporter substrate-binding protein n=1 Tax=Rathayibacter sp. SD072 TaxID=2781731 RepID=UPI001A95C6DC|nr:ABC transporter substrate-binding protein [Rathayibacter sp. SD072]MBO0984577.1 ABC transporter substrate-binding protein [Rathayibacter sp. SD072]